MKEYFYRFLSALAGSIVFGIGGFLKFMEYGASDCDMPGKMCDCFCCNSFGLRGYEACADYGFLIGSGIGSIIGIMIYRVIKRRYHKNNKH